MDNYPSDDARITRQLQKDVTQAQASAGSRQPLTEASKGWKIPDQGFPSTPASGGHLTASSNEPIWTGADGSVYSLKPSPVPQAGAVDSPANMTAGATAPGSYSAAYCEQLREDIRALRQTVFEILTELRTSDPPLMLS